MKGKELIKELRLKSEDELQKLLAESRETLRDLRFKVSQNQLKEVRKIREVRIKIAQILTVLNSNKKNNKK